MTRTITDPATGEPVSEVACGDTSSPLRRPIGTVAATTLRNLPLIVAVHRLGAARAAGCTVVIQPAPTTPTTTRRLVELAHAAGPPKGLAELPPERAADTSARADDQPDGLASSVWAWAIDRQLRVAPQLRARATCVCSHLPFAREMPHGARHGSGLGCDLGRDPAREVTVGRQMMVDERTGVRRA